MIDFIPNQKIIKINREKVDKGAGNNGRLYLVAYQDNITAAMNNLSHTGFKVYIYLLFNKDQFVVAYSPEYIHKLIGICNESEISSASLEISDTKYVFEYFANLKNQQMLGIII